MLRHLHLPEEVAEFTDQVKERDMAVLFEYFEDVDLPAERKKAREEGRAEGRAEGLARANRLAQILVEQNRMEDLKRSFRDTKYQEKLFIEFDI